MNKQTRNIINVSLTLVAIYLYSFTANNIETEILGFNSFKFLISIAVLIQFLIFLPSFIFKTEKFYDLTGSLTYISVTSIAYFSLDNPTTTDTILFLYVIIWAGRLGIFLFRKAEGVPMLERIAEERYGDLPEYQQYKENTPVLMMKIFK
jgi:steroid 5-alpha reductase family enzyme